MQESTHGGAIAEAFEALGASRIEAALLAELVAQGSADTAHIMDATGLRQPEVSVGMRELKERGWVATKTVPRHGKGRPMNRYELRVPMKVVCDHFGHTANQRIEEAEDAIEALADRLGCQPPMRRTPSSPARKTASHRPRNRPHSTTPG